MNLTNLENLPKEQTGVYTITNTESEKKYIGSTNDCFRRRIFNHRAQLRRDDHYNPHLQNSYNEHGEDSFEVKIVHKISGWDAIVAMEQEMIEKYHDNWQQVYNSEKDARRTQPWNKGKEDVYSKETLNKMSEAAKNRSNQEYVKRKQKEALKNGANPVKMWYQDGEYVGTFKSAKKIEKLSLQEGFDLKDEHLHYKNGNRASEELHVQSIRSVCNGHKDSYKGFIFEYVDEQQNG